MKRILLYIAVIAALCACSTSRKAVTTAELEKNVPASVQPVFEQEL